MSKPSRAEEETVDLIESLIQWVGESPLLGIFPASVIENVIPFFPVPYLLVVAFVASTNTGLGPIPVATIAAFGAATGKFTSYTIGYGAGQAFHGSRARFDSFRKLLGGSMFLAAFLFAASPFPDDIIFISMGVIRYSPVKTFISLFTGKFALTLLVAHTARTSSGIFGTGVRRECDCLHRIYHNRDCNRSTHYWDWLGGGLDAGAEGVSPKAPQGHTREAPWSSR